MLLAILFEVSCRDNFEFEPGYSKRNLKVLKRQVRPAIVFQSPCRVYLYQQLPNGTVFAHPLPFPQRVTFQQQILMETVMLTY